MSRIVINSLLRAISKDAKNVFKYKRIDSKIDAQKRLIGNIKNLEDKLVDFKEDDKDELKKQLAELKEKTIKDVEKARESGVQTVKRSLGRITSNRNVTSRFVKNTRKKQGYTYSDELLIDKEPKKKEKYEVIDNKLNYYTNDHKDNKESNLYFNRKNRVIKVLKKNYKGTQYENVLNPVYEDISETIVQGIKRHNILASWKKAFKNVEVVYKANGRRTVLKEISYAKKQNKFDMIKESVIKDGFTEEKFNEFINNSIKRGKEKKEKMQQEE